MLLQVNVIDVERKPSVIFFSADSRTWALCFTSAKIEEAELVPDQPPYVSFDG